MKYNKILRIKFTVKVQDWYTENHKILLKEMEELNKWRYPIFMDYKT